MNSTKGDNTLTNTLEQQIDAALHPERNGLLTKRGVAEGASHEHIIKESLAELIAQAVNKAEKNMWEKTTKAMRDILQENFHYRLMCGEVRDPDGKIDVMKEFVKYQELEPKRIKFSNYLEELKAKLETPNQEEGTE